MAGSLRTRLYGQVPFACLALAVVTGVVAIATAMAMESYAFDQGFGLMQDSFFAVFLAAPFAIVSVLGLAAARGARLATVRSEASSHARAIVGWSLPVLLFGVLASGGRHFERMDGTNPLTRVTVPIADLGISICLAAWVLAIAAAWAARRPLSQPPPS